MRKLIKRLALGLCICGFAAATSGAQSRSDVYTLGAGDKLRVIVFGEEDLSGEFEVDSAGWIAMPLIGEVRTAGRTVRQLEQAIVAKLLEGYLKKPQVSSEVLNYRPYFIDGEVEKPGEYPFRQGITIREAVAVAGGYTYWANKDDAFVTRRNDASRKKRKVKSNSLVLPGDYIWIED